jgi:diguanylate cyclase (GGDEF)-like protein
LEELSLQDGLTGIANRRNFDRTLEAEWHRAIRTRQAISLLLVDLDFFKNVNDVHGHPFGDRCLAEVAHALRSAAARSGDLVARYGGEEFAAILPGTTPEAAQTIAERMREAVLELKIPNETGLGPFVSVSIGGCTADGIGASSPAMLIETADQTLYKAKQRGRNRTEHTSLQG